MFFQINIFRRCISQAKFLNNRRKETLPFVMNSFSKDREQLWAFQITYVYCINIYSNQNGTLQVARVGKSVDQVR